MKWELVGATPKWREARTRERVQGDRDLRDEAKARKIAEAEETYAPRIANAQREVHERVTRGVENAYRFSIPMPDGQGLATTRPKDANEMNSRPERDDGPRYEGRDRPGQGDHERPCAAGREQGHQAKPRP